MEKYFNETTHKLETAINELEIEADYSIQRIEAVIDIILKCLSEVKEYVLNRGFKSINEEIRFFKYQKPAIVSKLIYYNTKSLPDFFDNLYKSLVFNRYSFFLKILK